MPIVKEYRVVLPMEVEEYQAAQLYSVAEASKDETGGGEGIEVVVNEPFDEISHAPTEPLLNGKFTTGQYTHKIFHLASKVPRFLRLLAPKGALEIQEVAWNAYPYCRTIISNPEYMKENFYIKIETMHLPDNGKTENALGLSPKEVENREVVQIDIANDPIPTSDYKEKQDPTKVKSEKTGRGPLLGNWKDTCKPVMCAYKLVSVEFKWWGLQTRVEKFIHKSERRIFTNFHRQVFCWMDEWYGLTMADIRAIEDKTKKDLDEQRQTGPVRGTKGAE